MVDSKARADCIKEIELLKVSYGILKKKNLVQAPQTYEFGFGTGWIDCSQTKFTRNGTF